MCVYERERDGAIYEFILIKVLEDLTMNWIITTLKFVIKTYILCVIQYYIQFIKEELLIWL